MKLKVGLQLYSVRNSLAEDPLGTLEKLAKIGYRYLEAANHDAENDFGLGFGVPARDMKKTLESLGLSIIGNLVMPIKLESLDRILDYQLEIGNEQIGYPIDFFPYDDLDFVRHRCDFYNEIGQRCKERGMRFYYHNHHHEFQKFGDKTVHQIILENTDPSVVFVELDTYWAARGGKNPVELIEELGDRLILLHQKDFPADAPQNLVIFDGVINPVRNITREVTSATSFPSNFTEIGHGILPIQNIIEAAVKAPNLEHIVLEQDFTKLDEIESVKVSWDAFQKFSGIK